MVKGVVMLMVEKSYALSCDQINIKPRFVKHIMIMETVHMVSDAHLFIK